MESTLTMSYNNPNDTTIKNKLDDFFYDLNKFIDFSIQLTKLIKESHANQIIKTDLTANSILVSADFSDIKIIDSSLEPDKQYLAPEQLDLISCPVDNRTNLYSLGIIFYELLTKKLPLYDETQTVELDFTQNKTIPKTIIYIVKKLLNKYPQDRYQSAEGLLYDLDKCKEQLDKNGAIDSFFPGAKDKPTKLVFSDYLYGREKEEIEIRAMYEYVSSGNSGFLLVSGYSGIGKTALVNQILKPLVIQNGLFIQGKYDQLHNQPYVAILEAIKNFIEKISQTKDALAFWREKFNNSLYPNTQVLIDLVPEFTTIVGNQPSPPILNPEKAKIRFNYVFHNFIKCITNEYNPLVIFLDDLQWIDIPSIDIIKNIIESEMGNFLMVGAYRDNECHIGHPLFELINELKANGQKINYVPLAGISSENVYEQIDSLFKKGNTISEIPLEGLGINHIQEHLEDLFKCEEQEAKKLSEIIHRKTLGNPFFVKQLLNNLQEEQKIIFNSAKNEWQWAIKNINKLDLADNVGELMARRIGNLEKDTQNILKYAACLGNHFDLNTLSTILDISLLNLELSLWDAVNKNLIFRIKSENDFEDQNLPYKFLHDKIQLSVYNLIPDKFKAIIHCAPRKRLVNGGESP